MTKFEKCCPVRLPKRGGGELGIKNFLQVCALFEELCLWKSGLDANAVIKYTMERLKL